MIATIDRHPTLAFLDGRYVNVTGDTMTGTLQIDVATTTSEALILKTTDDNTTKNIVEWQNSAGAITLAIKPTGDIFTDRWQARDDNTFFGVGVVGAGNLAVNGYYNAVFGYQAGYELTTGSANCLWGWSTGKGIKTGTNNMGVGYNCLQNVTSGVDNVAIGTSALQGSTGAGSICDASYNVCLGREAGQALRTDGHYNIFIGWRAGNTVQTGTWNILIGDSKNPPAVDTSKYLMIGDFITGDLKSPYTGTGSLIGAALQLEAPLAASKCLICKGAASQTGNLAEWQNSAGTPLVYVDADGDIVVDSATKGVILGAAQTTLLYGAGDGNFRVKGTSVANMQLEISAGRKNIFQMDNSSWVDVAPNAGVHVHYFEDTINNRAKWVRYFGWPNGQSKKYGQFRVVAGTTTPRFQISTDGEAIELANDVVTTGGRVVNTTRVTTAYTILATDHVVYCDTDGGAFITTLPTGVNGAYYRITNTGSAGLDITVTPDGAELLKGVNASQTISDGETMIVVYETTEGWW